VVLLARPRGLMGAKQNTQRNSNEDRNDRFENRPCFTQASRCLMPLALRASVFSLEKAETQMRGHHASGDGAQSMCRLHRRMVSFGHGSGWHRRHAAGMHSLATLQAAKLVPCVVDGGGTRPSPTVIGILIWRAEQECISRC